MRQRIFGLTMGASVVGLALGGGCGGDPKPDPDGAGGQGGALSEVPGTGGEAPSPSCCEVGSECAPGLVPCAVDCPGSTVACAAGDLCAKNTRGVVFGCTSECPAERRCEDICCGEGASCAESGECQQI